MEGKNTKKSSNNASKNTKLIVKKNKGKAKKTKFSINHPKTVKALKIIGIALIILIIIMTGIVVGMFCGLFGSDFSITKEELLVGNSNSIILDKDGNEIVTLNADENRKNITRAEMSDYLPKAFVSIEDERFYEHNGVDFKRTLAATINYILHRGSSSFGGSTITQQLIKNITDETDNSGFAGVKRKIGEMTKAIQVENMLSKDQILEMYLNIIYLGGGGKNVCGVEMASHYYFTKTAKELTIAESAYIAGITHSPNSYNPFSESPNMERINTRIKTVLNKMYKLGNITEEEYNTAVSEVDSGLAFKEGEVLSNFYSYHTEAAINQILDQLVQEKGMDRKYAEKYLYNGGFKIYSTQDVNIQKKIEAEYSKSKWIVKSSKYEGATTQSAMVIIDHTTGNVLGTVGGLGERTAFGINRVMSSRQPGSAIKPIAIVAPGLEEGMITAASVVDDTPVSFGDYNPHNVYSGYRGLSNIRYFIRISQNIPAVKLMSQLTPSTAIKYLEKQGVTSIVKEKDSNLALALGGMTYGISPLEMAAAYATIANDGVYIEPTFYTKVEDISGNIILQPNQETRRVYSAENAFIAKEILTEPTKSGGTTTATAISGMDVSSKSGTTNDRYDVWCCGFTPYYTAATWYGYDKNESVTSGTATRIWAAVMSEVHKGLEGKRYSMPSNIVTASVCMDSGLIATDACSQDQRGSRVYTEYFVKGTVPKETCTCHVRADVCSDTNKLASDRYCQNVVSKVFITRPNADTDTSWKVAGDAEYMLTDEYCDVHTSPIVIETPVAPPEKNAKNNKPKQVENENNKEETSLNEQGEIAEGGTTGENVTQSEQGGTTGENSGGTTEEESGGEIN